MWRYLLVVCVLLPLACTAEPTLSPQQLEQQLASEQHSHGTFIQQHFLADMDTTMVSKGSYDYQRSQSVIWHFEAPVKQTLTLTHQGVLRNNKPINEMPEQVSRLILSLIDGDFDTLKSNFDIILSGTPSAWQAELTPKSTEVRTTLSRIELRGAKQITRVVLFLAKGDRQTIQLMPATE